MNNTQFRNLLLSNSQPKAHLNPIDGDSSMPPPQPSRAQTLGAKRSSFMPMTPRVLKGQQNVENEFARQMRERQSEEQGPSKKKFKAAVPKGVRYGSGYVDRAKARLEAEATEKEKEADAGEQERTARVKALEEQMALGQISEEVFVELRAKILGPSAGSAQPTKGLDWALLERARRGEDVLVEDGAVNNGEVEVGESGKDVEAELEKLVGDDVQTITREKEKKKGSMAPPSQHKAGIKRSRDEIMAELKAQRKAAAESKAAPMLDNRWRKVGEERSRIRIDSKGREVLITVDEDGVVKKKVRKLPTAESVGPAMPDSSKPVLGSGALVPEAKQEMSLIENEEDDDIFEGVGNAYDPLGQDDEGASEASDTEDDATPPTARAVGERPQVAPPEAPGEVTSAEVEKATAKDQPDPKAAPRRNYFKDTMSQATEESHTDHLAGVQELLKKAARSDDVRSNDKASDNDDSEAEAKDDREARLQKRARMLASNDRDMDDMDMGFGSSRYDDGEDEEEGGKKTKLSEWKGSVGDDEHGAKDTRTGGKGGGDHEKRKRKPKKRKGDTNNMADIMRVIEGRKK